MDDNTKQYIGKTEALEICLENNHNLPLQGKEILHSRQVGVQSDLIGKDKTGYYTQWIS